MRARLHPGSSGIWFRSGVSRWEAVPENVSDTSRCTRLGEVSTVEHLMSAFAGLGVTDAEVEVDGGELPALDGCAVAYCSAIERIGLAEIGERGVKVPFSRVFHAEGDNKIAASRGAGVWRYEFECGGRWPGSQHFECALDPLSYVVEVAPARTFAFSEEYEAIRAAGLGRGLDEASAFLITESGYANEVRFADEPARHKLLDLVGDLYLSGVPVSLLNVVATRSGHRTNVAAAEKLRRAVSVSSHIE